MARFPLPGDGSAEVAVAAPAAGPGNWAGASSAGLDGDGSFVIAYRVRSAEARGSSVVIARSIDGVQLETVAVLDKERFGAESLERPALVRTAAGRWRVYVSCATPGSKHWRIDALEADDPASLQHAAALTVLPGDAYTGVKDPVVRRTGHAQWHAWICCHPLDVPGAEDRMYTRFAASEDGLTWTWGAVALTGRAGVWDARGARVTAVLPDGRAAYDGRANKEENFSERTGLTGPMQGPGLWQPDNTEPVSSVRYLDVVTLADGSHRIWYEAPQADGSHELRTEHIAAS